MWIDHGMQRLGRDLSSHSHLPVHRAGRASARALLVRAGPSSSPGSQRTVPCRCARACSRGPWAIHCAVARPASVPTDGSLFMADLPPEVNTTGMARCADGRGLHRRPNVGAVGVLPGQPSCSKRPSAYSHPRHMTRYAEGGPRRIGGPRHRLRVRPRPIAPRPCPN
jgi:hypothetical protein